MDVTSLVFVLALFLGLFQRGLSIKCYSCNSSPFQSGKDCEDLPDKSAFEIDCDLLKKNHTKCRKVVQNVVKKITVIRQCAFQGDDDGCNFRVGTKDVRMKYCHCSTDFCNASPHVASSSSRFLLLTMVTLAIVLTNGRHHLSR